MVPTPETAPHTAEKCGPKARLMTPWTEPSAWTTTAGSKGDAMALTSASVSTAWLPPWTWAATWGAVPLLADSGETVTPGVVPVYDKVTGSVPVNVIRTVL